MKLLPYKLFFPCLCLILILTASAAKAQTIYQAKERELITATSPDGNRTVTVVLPRRAIQPAEVALIVNSQDLQSVNVADYYRQTRNIPQANVVEISFPAGSTSITQQDFTVIKAQVDAAVNALPDIQALVITWTEPWMVRENDTTKGMAITSAFALGFHIDYYNDTDLICEATQATPYFNTDSVHPYSDFGLRPAMMLAGVGEQNVIELIDRGVSADQTFPGGDGYFIRTTDVNRSNPRFRTFINTVDLFNRPDALVMNYIDNSAGVASGNYLSNTPNILFYFTGLATVPEIDTNSYVAGAVADHLTSAGGRLTGPNPQMSILRWLEAGTIASYGTVIEPCNFTDKFPHTTNFVSAYFNGSTVLEAYWKSVRTPGEGIFVGDPLARPYGSRATIGNDGAMQIFTTIMMPGKTYTLLEAGSEDGPFTIVQTSIEVEQLRFTTINQSAGNSVYILAEDLAPNIRPNTPLLFLPEDGKTDVLPSPELQAYGLAGAAGDTHAATQWQISTLTGDFSSGVLALDVTSDSQLTTFIVPDFILNNNATYFWRAKFYYASGVQTEWSDPFAFTTMTSDGTDQNLNGIPDDQEIDDPNLDLDENGTPDVAQLDLKVVRSGFDNSPVAVKAGDNVASIDKLRWIDPDTIAEVQNRPENLPGGLINFKLSVNTPGASTGVSVYFIQPVPDGVQWYQYNSLTGWQDYSAHAVFSADRKSVTLTLLDGGFGDTDGTANGVIVDPSGIGVNSAPPATDTTDPPVENNPPATDTTDPPVENNPPATDTTDPPAENSPPADDATDTPGGSAEPQPKTADSGGGGGGGCLITSAADGFQFPNRIPALTGFFVFLLTGLIEFCRRSGASC